MKILYISMALITASAVLRLMGLGGVWVEGTSAQEGLRAFPGAEGFGANTPGGRGGRVIKVTNLDDEGEGSLRECAEEASGPRICVFTVSGIIVLHERIRIENPYVTIAGQTAPGGGITVRNDPNFGSYSFRITTHDVIIRGLRIRPGSHDVPSSQQRAITVDDGSENIILDHISTSWATDQVIDFTDGARNITLQWSIISEGLDDAGHGEGGHSKGLLISGKGDSGFHTQNISVHHNIFAHNSDRNPRNASWGLVDVVNNVIYNWDLRGAHTENVQTNVPTNFIGNFFKHGLDTQADRYEITGLYDNEKSNPKVRMYVKGNIGKHRPNDDLEENKIVDPKDFIDIEFVSVPFPAPPVTTTNAFEAYEQVLQYAGVIYPYRDPVDARIITDIKNGTGRIIDHENDVGGFPELPGGEAPVDEDGDGMPNAWEIARGLDFQDSSDANEIAPSGYTWIEEYINGLIPSPNSNPGSSKYDADMDGDHDILDFNILLSLGKLLPITEFNNFLKVFGL